MAVRVGAEEIHAGEAVEMQVDEAGDSDALGARGRDAQPGDRAVLDVDVAVDELAAGERGLDAQPHACTSALGRPLYLCPDGSGTSERLHCRRPRVLSRG